MKLPTSGDDEVVRKRDVEDFLVFRYTLRGWILGKGRKGKTRRKLESFMVIEGRRAPGGVTRVARRGEQGSDGKALQRAS